MKKAKEEQPLSSVSLITASSVFTHTVRLATAANILCKKDRDLVTQHSPYKPQFGSLFKFALEARHLPKNAIE